MRKNLKKKTAVLAISATLAVQTCLTGYAAPLTTGSWKQENGAWKFCDPDQNAYTGWILTASGWYYMDPLNGEMVTGWKQINGVWYHFGTQQEKQEGLMDTGWYQDGQGIWYFFDNRSGQKTEGAMVTGWNWIDGKCYYFSEADDLGAMYTDTITPDGFSVNDKGQWIDENGSVKTKNSSDFVTSAATVVTTGSNSGSKNTESSGGSDPTESSDNSDHSGSSSDKDNSGNNSSEDGKADGSTDDGKTDGDDHGRDDSGDDSSDKKDDQDKENDQDKSDDQDKKDDHDSSDDQDKKDDTEPTTRVLKGEATVAANDLGTVNGTYQAKVKVTVDKDGNIISVEDDGTEPGRNQSFWNDASELFEKFGGEQGAKTAEEVDQVQAVSYATISSNAIKEAVKKALKSEDPVEKPDAPTIKTADQRTRFLFSAAEPAQLLITAPKDTQIRYTTDGSDPAKNANAFTADGTGEETAIFVLANANATGTLILKAVAVKDGQSSDAAEKELSFIGIPETQEKGTKIYEASATITSQTKKPYEGKIRITVVNGKIVKIEDNGTEPVAIQDEVYWWYLFPTTTSFVGISTKFAGKDLSDLINAKTTPGGGDEYAADAVSRATISTDAMKYAAIQALLGDPVETSDEIVLTPKITSKYGFYSNPNATIYISIDKAETTTVRYTEDGTDPDVSSTKAETNSVSFYSNTPELKELRFAAFDEEGNRSKVVTVWYCFMKKSTTALERGSYTVEKDGITATVDVNYSGYISSIKLDETSQEKYSDFLPELLAHVYYEQSADIDILTQYEEEGQKAVLSAIGAAIKQAFSAAPVFSVEPAKGTSGTKYGNYDYEEKPVAAISCPVEGTQIYYYISDSSSTVSPDKETWTKYETPVSIEFDNVKGGSKYLWAATTADEGENWLKTSKIQFVYNKKPVENAVVNGEKSYKSFAEALKEVQEGDTLILNDDIELTDEVTMPEASISIQSGENGPYLIKSSKAISLKGNLTISDLTWNATLYANGYDFTAGENVTCSTTNGLYAGSASGTAQAQGENQTCHITLSSGGFYVYGSGAADSTMEGNVEVLAEKEAHIQFSGTYLYGSSYLNGDLSVTIDATDGNVVLSSLCGRTAAGSVSGDFTLTIIGAPQISKYTYIYAVQYDADAQWGILDVTGADLEALGLETLEKLQNKFKGFATIESDLEEEEEKTEEEITTELSAKAKEDEKEDSQEEKETETVIPAEDPETEDREETEDESENELEAEDKSNEDTSDAAENVKEGENSDEEDRSAEEEDPEETEDADFKENEEEDAPEVPEADETTEDIV